MRILVIHNAYKQFGGEDTVVSQEIEAYKKLGHQIQTYIVSNSELTFLDLVLSPFNIISAFRLKKVIKRFKPEVVHVHNFVLKLSPAIFSVIPKKTKVMVTIHNYRFLCPSGTLFVDGKIDKSSMNTIGLIKNIKRGVYQNSSIKTLILSLIYKINFLSRTFERIDTFIFLNSFSRQIHLQWKKKLFKKAEIKSNFLLGDFEINLNRREIDIIFIGRFTVEKGILDVLPNLIKQNHLNIHLLGDGPCFEEVQHRTLGYPHIKLHGSLPRSKVITMLEKSKFLIFPSIWYEGMPMTIIEAYSKSVPVISRNVGAMGDMIIDNLTGFHFNNKDELNTILGKLKSYNHLKLRKNAFIEFEKKYNESSGLRNLEALIND